MGRPRKFDLDETLNRAMRLFWERGFDGVSLQDLLKELAIKNSSFYHAFGSKEALFDEVLRYYFNRIGAYRVAPLLEDRPARAKLEAYFDLLIELNLGAGNPCGCLVANSVVLTSSAAPAVARKVEATVLKTKKRLEGAFFQTLSRGRERGEIRAEIDPRGHARLLVALVFGTNITARVSRSRRELMDIKESVIRGCCSEVSASKTKNK